MDYNKSTDYPNNKGPINKLIFYLKQPFPSIRNHSNRWLTILIISIFISFFLLLFQPFGLQTENFKYKWLFLIGYGGVTFIVLALLLILLPFLLRSIFSEKKWKVWKHLVMSVIVLLTIGVGNFLYTYHFTYLKWSWNTFFMFQFFTLLIGIFPITIITLYSLIQKLKKNLQLTNSINANISQKALTGNQQSEMIEITGKNKNEKIRLNLNQLCFIRSEGNYVQLFFLNENEVQQELIRNTLTNINDQLKNKASIVQCHRAYLVNTDKIYEAQGNAQGFLLKIKGMDDTVPVSRKFVPKIKESLLNQ